MVSRICTLTGHSITELQTFFLTSFNLIEIGQDIEIVLCEGLIKPDIVK